MFLTEQHLFLYLLSSAKNILKLDIYQIDAFTNKMFGGNPACAVQLREWLENDLLLKIATENAVAETAFFIIRDNKIQLRWFTPEIEMDLCGHATLATAHCLKTILNLKNNHFIFGTLSGDINVAVDKNLYSLDLPSRMPIVNSLPVNIQKSLNIQPMEVLKSRDYVLVYENEAQVKGIKINRQYFDEINLGTGGVIVTAKGDESDFVSRFFTPQASILEDPVTGSAHCSLVPYWAKILNRKELHALQVSERMGELHCIDKGERIIIKGQAKTYSVGTLWTE